MNASVDSPIALVTKVLLLSAVVLVLPACKSLGNKSFACGMPGGVSCASLPEVYAATDGPDYRERHAAREAKATKSRSGRRSKQDTPDPEVLMDQALASAQLHSSHVPAPVPDVDGTIPLRSRAGVLRVWVAPYEDGRGDLHTPGYVYVEIEPRRWTIGQPGNAARAVPSAYQVNPALGGGASTPPNFGADGPVQADRPGGRVTRNRNAGR